MKKLLSMLLLFVLILAGAAYWYWDARAANRTVFRFEEVTHGHLVATIGSTGTVQAQEVVDVGAQVLGRLIFIGKDPNSQSKIVDWGSEVEGPVLNLPPITGAAPDPAGSGNIQITTANPISGSLATGDLVSISGVQGNTAANGLSYITVTGGNTFLLQNSASNGVYLPPASADRAAKVIKQGTVLAQIDPALYAAQVAVSKAQVLSAKADLLQKNATLEKATADWGRAQKLFKPGAGSQQEGIAKAEYDQYEAAFEVAKANVEVSKANIGVAEANLWNNQTNLEYCTITAPVKGIVIDRRVNVGQTVVASLSAPSLFLIAKDLKKLEVWATVNEVDVSKISNGQDVTFTVDSLPGRIYKGKVVPQGKLSRRLNATMNQNVVTYTVVVSVDNTDGLLSPYMTTNLSFIVADRSNVLLAPNAALRWQPTKQQIILRTALRALRRNVLRSALTCLGIVIAVAAVIAMVEIGNGSSSAMQKTIASMGANILLVFPGAASTGGISFGGGSGITLTPRTPTPSPAECPAVAASPRRPRPRPVDLRQQKLGIRSTSYGTTPSFLDVRDWTDLEEGIPSPTQDVRNASQGLPHRPNHRTQLFGDESPIGKEIRLQNVGLKVVGVLSRKGANMMGHDQDDILVAPWTTIKYRINGGGGTSVNQGTARRQRHHRHRQQRPPPNPSYPEASRPTSIPRSFRHRRRGHPAITRFTNIDQILVGAANSTEDIPEAIPTKSPLCCASATTSRAGPPEDFTVRDMTEMANALTSTSRLMTQLAPVRRHHLPRRRRRRHHEHHDGLRHRTHPRNRPAHGRRRQGPRHPAPVPRRSRRAVPHRRLMGLIRRAPRAPSSSPPFCTGPPGLARRRRRRPRRLGRPSASSSVIIRRGKPRAWIPSKRFVTNEKDRLQRRRRRRCRGVDNWLDVSVAKENRVRGAVRDRAQLPADVRAVDAAIRVVEENVEAEIGRGAGV
jgi:RND family efflux transporter MFP subunit